MLRGAERETLRSFSLVDSGKIFIFASGYKCTIIGMFRGTGSDDKEIICPSLLKTKKKL